MRILSVIAGAMMAITIVIMIYWCVQVYHIKLPVAPNITMLQNCDSMSAVTHVKNYDNKSITFSYKEYMDVNDNKVIDSVDVLIHTSPEVTLAPLAEYVGIPIRPMFKYSGHSFLVKLRTVELVTYYVSIPCDTQISLRDSTPTK